jgi:hypothetical protein
MKMYEILTLVLSLLVFFQAEKIVASCFKFSKLLSDKFFESIGATFQVPFKIIFYIIKKAFLGIKYVVNILLKRTTQKPMKADRYTVEPILKVTPVTVQQVKKGALGNNKREPVIIEYIQE